MLNRNMKVANIKITEVLLVFKKHIEKLKMYQLQTILKKTAFNLINDENLDVRRDCVAVLRQRLKIS